MPPRSALFAPFEPDPGAVLSRSELAGWIRMLRNEDSLETVAQRVAAPPSLVRAAEDPTDPSLDPLRLRLVRALRPELTVRQVFVVEAAPPPEPLDDDA